MPAACSKGGGGDVKTLLWVGGPVHDWRGIAKVVEPVMRLYGRFDITVVADDFDAFLAERLEPFDVVVFFNTGGELTPAQKQGLVGFVEGGGGFVGFHSAADSFHDDLEDWHRFLGGHFVGHPAYRKYPVTIVDKRHPVTRGMDDFEITDEQYYLDYDKDRIHVLATGPGKEPGDPPMPAVWVRQPGKGRLFYMGFGHDARVCHDPNFKRLLCRATLWAAGRRSLEPGRRR
jgi:type 1 glutamine amidotransferase